MLADEHVLVVLAHDVVLVLRLARTGEKAVLRRMALKVLKRLGRVDCMLVVVAGLVGLVMLVVDIGRLFEVEFEFGAEWLMKVCLDGPSRKLGEQK